MKTSVKNGFRHSCLVVESSHIDFYRKKAETVRVFQTKAEAATQQKKTGKKIIYFLKFSALRFANIISKRIFSLQFTDSSTLHHFMTKHTSHL
jgi:hypothetical protein